MPRRRTRTRDERTDVVRGLLLATVAAGAMAGLDNLPGSLGPAAWDGFGLADLVVGAFPIVAGVALGWRTTAPTWKRLGRRVALLGGAGLVVSLAVHGLPLVWTGPLQQLALASAVGAVVAHQRRQVRLGTGAVLVAAHAWMLLASPLAGAGSLRPSLNAASTLDQAVLGSRALHPVDPWGVAALPMVVALVIAGVEMGTWLRSRPNGPATAAALVVMAAWLAVGGLGGALVLPVNRSLATPTWGLLSASFALALFGVVHAALAMRGRTLLAPVGRIGQHGLVVVSVLSAAGALLVGDGTTGPWRGLRDGLLEPVAGDGWVWVYVSTGVLCALFLSRWLDQRNWRLTA